MRPISWGGSNWIQWDERPWERIGKWQYFFIWQSGSPEKREAYWNCASNNGKNNAEARGPCYAGVREWERLERVVRVVKWF
jgi:hypothetical protein